MPDVENQGDNKMKKHDSQNPECPNVRIYRKNRTRWRFSQEDRAENIKGLK